MKKLRIVLQCKYFYYSLLVFSLLFSFYKVNQKLETYYDGDETFFKGIIKKIVKEEGKVTIDFYSKELLHGVYYLDEKENFNYKIGDYVECTGKLEEPSHATVPNMFDYANYLNRKGKYWILKIDSINKTGSSNNIYYLVKNAFYQKIEDYRSSKYLKTFILGEQQEIDDEVVESYRANGISHLFSISGMHISFLSGMLFFVLARLKIKKVFASIIVCFLLFIYMFLVGCLPSVMRSTIFFLLLTFFRIGKIQVSNILIFYFMVAILLFINPLIIFELGFQYSVSISFFLILMSQKTTESNYIVSLLKVSILSFLVSLPITLYSFFEVNFLGILYNLFFVPIVSFIVFPLSLFTFCFPCFDSLFYYITEIMENISLFLASISFGKVIFMKPEWWFIILYYSCMIGCFFYKKFIFLIVFLIIIFYFHPLLFPKEQFLMIDVGQGDSLLIMSKNESMLIDTGGKVSFNNSNILAKNTLIPLFKSYGIRKLNYLVLTHGDYDHMGEAINLVNNFEVDKVIFNCGEYNDLELELIKTLNDKNIKYYKNMKELYMGNNRLYFLNDKLYDNENDNSNVIYTEFNGIKLLFMGDAGIEVEKDILNKYNLKDIDILKVGHHGSKTSTSSNFINQINPKYSIISVGRNNRYGHPNKEVLENLKDTKIYRTDQNGSIMFKIKNDKLKIETCAP